MAAGGGGGAAQAAAIAQAIKASGVLVSVTPENFMRIVKRQEAPVVVVAETGVFSTKYQYLTTYKGLAFYVKSPDRLSIPMAAEVIAAEKIWIPG